MSHMEITHVALGQITTARGANYMGYNVWAAGLGTTQKGLKSALISELNSAWLTRFKFCSGPESRARSIGCCPLDYSEELISALF
jgi:hypothetical protein